MRSTYVTLSVTTILGLVLAGLVGCGSKTPSPAPSASVAFASPEDGDNFGVGDDVAPGTPGIQIDVELLVTSRIEGAQLELRRQGVTGPLHSVTLDDEINEEIVRVEAVTLVNGPNTLVATILVDGELISSDTITVTAEGSIDPSTASLRFLAPTDGDVFTPTDDQDPGRPGVQTAVTIGTERVPQGTRVTLENNNVQAGPSVNTSGDGEALFPRVTLADGANTLRASAIVDGQTITATITVTLIDDGSAIVRITEPQDGDTLRSVDDTDPDTPGFQTTVRAELADVPVGTPVSASVNGSVVETMSAAGDTITFSNVTLGAGTNVIGVSTVLGEIEVSDAVSVTVELDDEVNCPVTLSPAPMTDACEFVVGTEDVNPAVPGTQVRFVVETTCTSAELRVNDVTVDNRAVVDGAATFEVTITDGTFTVQALASDEIRTGASPTQAYRAKLSAPNATIDPDALGVVLPTFDRDPDTDGLQWDIYGFAEADPGDLIEVFLDDALVGTTTVTEERTWRLANVTFTENQRVEVLVTVTDSCGNSASAGPGTLDVYVDPPPLIILSPAPGALLGLAADTDLDTPGLQALFSIQGEFDVDTEVAIECRPVNTAPFATRAVGAFGEDQSAEVTVTLAEGFSECRASVSSPLRTRSPSVDLLVDTVAPVPEIRAPEDGSIVNTATPTLSVVISSTRVDEVLSATYQVDDGPEIGVAIVAAGIFSPIDVGDDGLKTVRVTVTDAAGNAGVDEVTFQVDTQPIVLDVTFPAQDEVVDVSEVDVSGDDIRIVARAEVAGTDDDAEVCVRSDAVAARCTPATVDGTIDLPAFPVFPGANTLHVDAIDGAGNITTVTRDFVVDIDLPRLAIVDPVDGAFLSTPTGNTVQVETDLAEGVSVDILVNGALAGSGLTDDEGRVAVGGIDYTEGVNTIQAVGTDARGEGRSPQINITLETDIPAVAFISPTDGDVLNASAPDSSGQPGFQTNITVDPGSAQDGQPARLLVSCDGGLSAEHDTSVIDNLVRFTNVTLPDDDTCTLTAEVTDRAGNIGTDTITIVIDRIPPTVSWVFPSNGQTLTALNDVSEEPGIQIDARVRAVDSVVGAQFTILMSSPDRETPLLTLSPELTSPTQTVTVPELDIDDGVVQLSATIEDAVGNVSDPAIITVTAVSDLSGIRISAPGDGARLNSINDIRPDEPGLQIDIVAEVTGPFGDADAQLCIESDDSETYPTACETGGFRRVALTSVAAGTARFFNVSLPEGTVTLTGELVLEGGDVILGRNRVTYVIDTVPPELLSIDVIGDTNGDGFISASEDLTPGTPPAQTEVALTFDGLEDGRPVQVRSNNPTADTIVGSGIVNDDAVTVVVSLAEGAHILSATAMDEAGNPVADDAPTAAIIVDTVAPIITFVAPLDGDTLNADDDADSDPSNGLQFLVRVSTVGVPNGATVDLLVNGIGEDIPFTVTDGAASATVTLPEGNVNLQATVSDAAGNTGTTSIDVFVDSIAPELTFVTPSSADVIQIDEDDDISPADGIQVLVAVNVTGAEIGQPILIRSVLTGDVISSGATVTGTNPEQIEVTFRLAGLHTLTGEVSDVAGNRTVAAGGTFDVEIDGCGITFSTLRDPHFFNASDDDDSDPSNGLQTSIEVNVLSSLCDGQTVTIVLDDVPIGTAVVDDGNASIPISLPHGTTGVLQARVTDPDDNDSTTTPVNITVDLVPPAFVSILPGGGDPTVLGRDDAATLDPDTVDFVIVTDDAIGGRLVIERGGATLADVPVVSDTVIIPEIPFEDGEHTLTFILRDEAGNVTIQLEDYLVQFEPPAAFVFGITQLNRRTGHTEISWNGDPSAATEYLVRTSPDPIDSEAAWDALDGDPNSLQFDAVAGSMTALYETLAPFQSEHFIAVRARDLADNLSPLLPEEIFVGLLSIDIDLPYTAASNSISNLGDVNSDGFDDFAVRANGTDVFVIYGAENAEDITHSSIPVVDGSSGFGTQVHGFGDVNGDGIDDIFITAPLSNQAFIYFGVDLDAEGNPQPVSTEPDVEITYTSATAAPLPGLTPLNGRGNVVDVAGEGINDIVIGAISDLAGDGVVVAIAGRETWPSLLEIGNNPATNAALGVATIRGTGTPNSFGGQITIVPDTDGDGYDDLAVSARSSTNQRGSVFFYYGRDLFCDPDTGAMCFDDDGLLSTDTDAPCVGAPPCADFPYYRGGNTQANWSIRGIGAGDFDGDGIADIAVADGQENNLDIIRGGDPMPNAISYQAEIDGFPTFRIGNRLAVVGDLRRNDLDPDAGPMFEDIIVQNIPRTGSVGAFYLLLLNDGTGQFPTEDSVFLGMTGNTPAVLDGGGDINGDGLRDFAITLPGGIVRLYY